MASEYHRAETRAGMSSAEIDPDTSGAAIEIIQGGASIACLSELFDADGKLTPEWQEKLRSNPKFSTQWGMFERILNRFYTKSNPQVDSFLIDHIWDMFQTVATSCVGLVLITSGQDDDAARPEISQGEALFSYSPSQPSHGTSSIDPGQFQAQAQVQVQDHVQALSSLGSQFADTESGAAGYRAGTRTITNVPHNNPYSGTETESKFAALLAQPSEVSQRPAGTISAMRPLAAMPQLNPRSPSTGTQSSTGFTSTSSPSPRGRGRGGRSVSSATSVSRFATEEDRKKTSDMRKQGACWDCFRTKKSCDPSHRDSPRDFDHSLQVKNLRPIMEERLARLAKLADAKAVGNH